MRRIKGRKLSRELYLVGLSGEHPLDMVRIGRWLKSILRIGGGRIESLQRRLLGVQRMSSWRVRGRRDDGEVEARLFGITTHIGIPTCIAVVGDAALMHMISQSSAFTHQHNLQYRPTRSVQFVIPARPAYIPSTVLSTPPKEIHRQGLSLQPLQDAGKQTYSTDERQFWL